MHQATLELLERTGVQMSASPRASRCLQGGGAHVDGNRVRIPAWMVEAGAPHGAVRASFWRTVAGTARSISRATSTGSGQASTASTISIPLTDQRRRFTSDDCRVTVTVADALPNYTWVMTIGMADDVPPDIADRVVAKQVFTYTEKPLVFCCKDVKASAISTRWRSRLPGGEAKFRQAPTIVHYSEPISPLLYYDPAVEKILYCAETGHPADQLPRAPGRQHRACHACGRNRAGQRRIAERAGAGAAVPARAHPSSTARSRPRWTCARRSSRTATPEYTVMVAAMAQLAQRYRIPFFGTAGCTDAKFPDAQAAAEVAFSCLASAAVGANLIHDAGSWLDHGSLASPAFMVLVSEILYMVNQFMGGVPVNDETLALDVMDRVGPGGHYLNEEHTLSTTRRCGTRTCSTARSTRPGWTGAREKFDERLREKTAQNDDSINRSPCRKTLRASSRRWPRTGSRSGMACPATAVSQKERAHVGGLRSVIRSRARRAI